MALWIDLFEPQLRNLPMTHNTKAVSVIDTSLRDRVEALIHACPDWWETCVQEMCIDLLSKLGRDPRDPPMAGMFISAFLSAVEIIPRGHPAWNPICTELGHKLHPTINFQEYGMIDDIITEFSRAHALRLDCMMMEEMDDYPGMNDDHDD